MGGEEIEFAAINRWLARCGIRTLAEWDTLVFLDRHPFSLLNAVDISSLSGHGRAEVVEAIKTLQKLGLVHTLFFPGSRSMYHRIAPPEQSRKEAVGHLMRLADNRLVRLALMKRLGRSASLLERSRRPEFLVVAFGGSAGALFPMREILRYLPNDTGMAFVVVQHLFPNTESLLPEILSQETKMPVLRIENGMRLQPNRVFVIPPNTHLKITGAVLRLSPRISDEQGRNRTIDIFFTSLAQERTTGAVSVILSGLDSDGIMGTAAIKFAGGVTLAQTVESAIQQALPRNVVDDGCVDFVGTPRAIAERLIELSESRA